MIMSCDGVHELGACDCVVQLAKIKCCMEEGVAALPGVPNQ